MSTGEYFDTADYSAQYLHCFYKYKCKSVSKYFQLLAWYFVNILVNYIFKSKIFNLRLTIKIMLKLEKKKKKKKKKENKK